MWKTWEADIICLQETRIGRNNIKHAKKTFECVGYTPCLSDPLPGMWHAKGSTKTPCGGCAVIGGSAYIRPFDPKEDHTGLYAQLYATRRFTAAWVQVTHSKFALVMSVYAQTGASCDARIHEENDALFSKIFTFVTQFGQIPIILAADFQAAPNNYPSIASVLAFHSWADPISTTDSDGALVRPITFSQDGTFASSQDGCSSIDGILLNSIAFAALTDACVLEHFGRQHRPIQVKFSWPSIEQRGFILYKTAPLLLNEVSQPVDCNHAITKWSSAFENTYNHADSLDEKWQIVNSFLQQSLLDRGAKWGMGPKERACPPRFVAKTIAPKQLASHSAATTRGLKFSKLISRLNELYTRLSRDQGNPHDVYITQQTARKAWSSLSELSAPVGWHYPSRPSLTEVYLVRQWASQALETHEAEVRVQRIKRWKAKIQHSAASGCKFIFQHLKNKQQDEPSNLVLDEAQNIVYNPEQALHVLNETWDDIFSANTLCEHPLRMLDTVWPYIQHTQVPADIPPITGEALFSQLKKRRIDAAPGLDGWRTDELRTLTAQELAPVAKFFAELETSSESIPDALVCAKQMILNKPGPATPLNKRLITVLPALLLAYTGTRFAQLQKWQAAVMPSGVLGGIKNRHMSTLYNEIRLEIDCAKLDATPLIGLKLDKAKAFDRIIPSYAAALFLAFGIPKTVVNVFLKIYQNLHRHLAYRNWCSPISTTPANGVAQGCSFSLLAMNAYNKVWFHLLEHIPQISARAFIDDAYMWCHLHHSAMLQKAIDLTNLWDKLAGQKLNPHKSSMWGTTSQARKTLREEFPDFPVELEIIVLGARMYCSERESFGFPSSTLKRVLGDIDNIAALPIPHKTRVHLIGAKVIPQISFGCHISKIPKKDIQTIQSAIARALWVGRPKWRSRTLLQAIHAQPFRTDPVFANAYQTVFETIRLCNTAPGIIPKLKRTLGAHDNTKHALALSLRDAAHTLGLQLNTDLGLSFQGSQPLDLTKVRPIDVKRAMQHITRHACYVSTPHNGRKDFCKPSGIFDFTQSTLILQQKEETVPGVISDSSRFESVVIGCTLTNDRMASSGWTESAVCRFCGETKESMPNLVQCTALHPLIGSPIPHEFGPNFLMLGHVQHPHFIGRKRLLSLDTNTIACAAHFALGPLRKVWTDGSVIFPTKFWLTTATYAVIAEDFSVVSQGQVNAWNLASYTAELWAVVVACTKACGPTNIFSDSLTVVQQCNEVFDHGVIGDDWLCSTWWRHLRDLYRYRQETVNPPFLIQWVPAHRLERVPDQLLTDELAACAGTTKEHILHNRRADLVAKELAYRLAPVDCAMQRQADQAILQHHRWLINLHRLLPTSVPPTNVEVAPRVEAVADVTPDQCKARFPQWMWGLRPSLFTWKPKIPAQCPCPARWARPERDWHTLCAFFRSLKWLPDDQQSFSFSELTVCFHCEGFRLEGDQQQLTFYDIYKPLRACLLALHKSDYADPFPGKFNSTFPRSCGRVMPQGCIEGCTPFHTDLTRVTLARIFSAGAGRTLESWKLSLSDF